MKTDHYPESGARRTYNDQIPALASHFFRQMALHISTQVVPLLLGRRVGSGVRSHTFEICALTSGLVLDLPLVNLVC